MQKYKQQKVFDELTSHFTEAQKIVAKLAISFPKIKFTLHNEE